MEIAVTLKSKTIHQINRFADAYFGSPQHIAPETKQLTYIFTHALDANDIVTTFVDNCSDYDAQIWVDFDGLNARVTADNLYLVLCSIFQRVA